MTQPSELDRARHDCAEGEALLAAGHPGEAVRAFRSVLSGVGAIVPAASLGSGASDGTAGGGTSGGPASRGAGAPDGRAGRAPGASDRAADASDRAVDASRTADSPERIVARACVGLGRARLATGNLVRAAEEFRQAARLDPAGLDPLYWLGCAAAHQGAYATAEQRFSRVLELSGGHGPSLVQRGYVRVRLGRTADALADLRSAERTGALDAEARWVLAALSGATARDVARLLGAAARAAMAQAQAARPEGRPRAATPQTQGAEAEGLSRSKTAHAQNSRPEGRPRPRPATPQAQNTTPDNGYHAATAQLQDAGPGGRSRSWDGWSRAVALLDRARQLDPGEREFVLPHAVALCLSGRRDDGLAVLTGASRSAPADRHLAHALAVMTWHALPPPDAAGREAVRAWARCVSLWAGLLHDTAFWERLRAEAAERYGTPVDDGALATLRTDLQARLEALMPEGNGGGRPSPEAVLNRESEAARLLAEAGGLLVAGGAAPLVCGPLRIVELGRERELGAFVAAAGKAAPALRQAFSHLGFAQALLRLGRPRDALTALSGLRCPSCRARGTGGGEASPSNRPQAAGAPGRHPADGAQETVRPPNRPNETAAPAQPQSPAPDARTAPRSEATPAPGSGHQPTPDQGGDTARSLPAGHQPGHHPPRDPGDHDRAAVCDTGCPHFDVRNPAYAGQDGKRGMLLRDGRLLALEARLALGRAALSPAAPDVRTAAVSWRRALAHGRALERAAKVEDMIAGTALAAAKALHRAGDIDSAGTTLEAAYALLGEGQHERLEGQLARVLADRGITRANRDPERLESPAADLRRAVELNPHLLRAHVNLGLVLRVLAAQLRWSGSLVGCRVRLQEAVDRLTAALGHFPGDPELAELREQADGDLARVRAELEQGRIGGLPG